MRTSTTRGSALEMERAFEDKILELSGVTSATKVDAGASPADSHGSVYDMMMAFQNTVDELSGSLMMSSEVVEDDEDAIAVLGSRDPEHQDKLERYLHSLIGDLTGILNDNGVFGTLFDYDDTNLYMTVSTEDNPATQYTIPLEDLTQDFNQIDKDLDYIIDGTVGQSSEHHVEASVDVNHEGDADYLGELEQIDQEAGELVQRYMKGDESPYDILTELGYEETESDFYTKAVDKYTRVFDFRYNGNDMMQDDYYCRYYVLQDDIIPAGFNQTKLNLYDESLDPHHLVDEVVDETIEGYTDISTEYTKIRSKQVLDSDGFLTDYTWYRDSDGLNVFVFGDNEVYGPEDGYFDHEEEDDAAAEEWFNSYNGFEDDEDDWDTLDADDIYSCDKSAPVEGAWGQGWYFGKEEADQFGDLISTNLSGKTVSKRRDLAEEPGGLIYEANQLGIDMWDLLRALEGMCYQQRAQEIDDSTYKIM